MISNVKTLVLAGLMTLPFAANAQPAAQDWEIILGGNGQATTEFKRDAAGNPGGQFGATLSLGYYLNDNLELAARQSLAYATSGTWVGYTRAAIDYNFQMDKLVPFLGVNVGYNYGNKGRTDSWGAAPEAGIKYYLQDKAFLFGMAEYSVPFRGRGPLDDGTWIFTLGLGVNL
jgi:hypothetical protein